MYSPSNEEGQDYCLSDNSPKDHPRSMLNNVRGTFLLKKGQKSSRWGISDSPQREAKLHLSQIHYVV